MKMSKYGSIEQFRNIVKAVKDSTYYNGKDDEGNVVAKFKKDTIAPGSIVSLSIPLMKLTDTVHTLTVSVEKQEG